MLRNAWKVAASFAVLAAAAGGVQAGALQLQVTEGGVPTVVILDNGVFDTNAAVGVINVNTSVLNPTLNSFTFTSLSASSNAPGSASLATISLAGTVLRTTPTFTGPGLGTGAITIDATDVGFTLPASASTLFSSATGNFTSTTAGDSETFRSWYNPSNVIDATVQASPLLTFTSNGTPLNSHSGDASGAITPATPFGLTDRITLSMPTVTGTPGQIQFSGSTAVPEPAALGLLLAPLLLTRLRRRV